MAITYDIRRSPAGQASWTTIATGLTSTEYNDTGLDPETEYDYQVRAYNGSVYSDWSSTVSATTLAVPAYRTHVLTDNPDYYWPLNEGTGTTVNDIETNELDAAIGAEQNYERAVAGPVDGMVATRVGAETEIRVTSYPSEANTITATFWLRIGTPASIAAYGGLLGFTDFSTSGWMLNRHDSNTAVLVRVDTSAGTNQNFGVGTIPVLDQEWHHIGVVLDSGSGAVYVDGQLDYSGNYDHGTGFATSTFDLLRWNSTDADAEVCEFALWHGTALTANQIEAQYDAAGLSTSLSASLTDAGVLNATPVNALSANLTDPGVLSATPVNALAASLTGAGVLTATLAEAIVAASINGSGILSAELASIPNLNANLTETGFIDAELVARPELATGLLNPGILDATVVIPPVLDTSLTDGGILDADLNAIVQLTVEMTGPGVLDATLDVPDVEVVAELLGSGILDASFPPPPDLSATLMGRGILWDSHVGPGTGLVPIDPDTGLPHRLTPEERESLIREGDTVRRIIPWGGIAGTVRVARLMIRQISDGTETRGWQLVDETAALTALAQGEWIRYRPPSRDRVDRQIVQARRLTERRKRDEV